MSILTVRCLHHQVCPQSQCLSWFGPLGTKLENTDGLRVQLEGEPGSAGGDPEAPEVGKMCFQGNLLNPVGGECLWKNLAAVSQGGPSAQPHSFSALCEFRTLHFRACPSQDTTYVVSTWLQSAPGIMH